MCGRFTLFATFDEIIERFDIDQMIDESLYTPNYNVAPSQSVLAVINDGTNSRLGYLRWGLIPSWAKDMKIGYKMINARAETLTEKPSYRNAYKQRRCLVLADSFYEWKRHDDKTKTPMRIKLKSDNLFAMAGLWETWRSPDGKPVHSCTIITTKPNKLVEEIHDRMPVIIKPEYESTWLDKSITNTDRLNDLLAPLPEDLMEAYAVSSLVNSPKNNNPNLIQKIS
ncbi:SOS response-associated peptidase [Oceanobacillus sp. J11TS1]|uniref:SOS response-associated peptidase n=1 Tax=Oceanobacillus sp. J11TS1 TaxID=2807191 RepID=UPI001B0C4185|nr:SOS response-associated peptidase [Oceanobacillus sp. J11TS1]GIO24794.1 putative SOS response-associated peptidase YoqW [Oceanobacillus sp. J11TS1]